jgi:hypothetical protein
MPIWNVEDVEGEPEIVLVRWRILETESGDRHLVGTREDDFTGRVSSAITKFDSSRMIATTRSGRIYRLRGAPGYNADSRYVWKHWCSENGVRKFIDVTASVYGQPKSAG